MDEAHRRIDRNLRVARHYARASTLQPGEKAILERLEGELSNRTMLDIGVGSGRTTGHFAPRVKRYIALDHSPVMLRAWCKRFSGAPYEFMLGDTRALPFNDHTFDFVLFSHNGIDDLDHDERPRVLREVRRVARAGGTFAFSTHVLERGDLPRAPSPGEGVFGREHHGLRHARDFRAAKYHVRHSEQLAQLHQAGFERVRAYSTTTGAEIVSLAYECPPDPWLYFLCRVT